MQSTLIKQSPYYGQEDEITDWSKLVQKYPEIPAPYEHNNSQLLQDAVEEAEGMELDVESEIGYREDLRWLPTMTIDPDYAHDHDDAISLLEEEDGYRAWVHIADVGHYVEPDSAIAEAALDRGVTFYLGDSTRHMVPPQLAQGICSLKPDTDRLAHTVEMKFDEGGDIDGFDIYKSVIKSDAHLTYSHADRMMENSDEILGWYEENDIVSDEAEIFKDLTESLSHLEPLTEDLRDKRWNTSLIINNRQSTSSKIVEEMMSSANWSVGQYLREEEDIGMYRHEDKPDSGWTKEAESDILSLGYQLPSEAHDPEHTKQALNDFFKNTEFEKIEGVKDEEKQVRKALIRNLPRANYKASSNGGVRHYGLGIGDYAHFTSPIRRAADLINHWTIGGQIDGTRNMKSTAKHISAQQKAADDANRLWHNGNG